MSDAPVTPPTNGQAAIPATPEPLPPYVTVVKTERGCQVMQNLIDPWLAVALLDMGRQALIDDMKKPTLITPAGNGQGLVEELRRRIAR